MMEVLIVNGVYLQKDIILNKDDERHKRATNKRQIDFDAIKRQMTTKAVQQVITYREKKILPKDFIQAFIEMTPKY